MFKNLIRVLSALIGAILGYGMCGLFFYVFQKAGIVLPEAAYERQFLIAVATAIIFAFIFFIIAPSMANQGVRLANSISRRPRSAAASTS